MQLKELTLKELLALFDATTHERIAECYADEGIHYIVVFANHFQSDMGLLTVGPTQECTSLEQAKRAIIDRKFAKYAVRCKHCPKETPKRGAAPAGLVRAPSPAAADPVPASDRHGELKEIEADLKRREADLLEREEYVAQAEEALILKIQEIERRGVELDHREEQLNKRAAK